MASDLPSITPGAKAAMESLNNAEQSLLWELNPLHWSMFSKSKTTKEPENEAYQAGETYDTTDEISTGLYEDLQAVGLECSPKQLGLLINVLKSKGKLVNDREMTMEKMIALISALPRTSTSRKKLTGVIIDGLWNSLQHPPLSYLGDKYQYRTADGSYNNPLNPDLGKAGMPYARTVKKLKHLKGTPPDPGLLFDLLMARSPESFKENPAGISSMLFYHATIIIHDIFRSNRFDSRISDTSSYLDLAPLYGSSLEDQLAVRTMQNGLLKPDTFSEKRLIGQPPGVNCILVMYNRFHNYVAETLAKINEYGRFTLPPTTTAEEKANAEKKRDEDLFQTARLIVNGLYINISLHDYLRGLTNTHHSLSDWTLDPRVDVDRLFDAEGVPKGVGNQVSVEFNLLYRFHSTISLRDEKWTNDFMQSVFPNLGKPLDQLTPLEFGCGLLKFEQSIPVDPSKREFNGLKRDPKTNKFDDGELVKILTESMEDPAGLFGARMVPKALKVVEIMGILSARKFQLASLNETRRHFGLMPHKKFTDLNPDTEVADLLQKFYQDPDMVEMYPGLFLEDAKPRMDPGCGGCPPYTVGRAIFSDAVTLVRSDRFLTLDYTVSTLTNWGMQEVQQDLDVLGGSMFYKLFHRAFPNWFPFNSLHIMQPMYTRKMNEQIAKELGVIDHYTLDPPTRPPPVEFVLEKELAKAILADQKHFVVPWTRPFKNMFGGKRKYEDYMLGGDTAAHSAQRKLVSDIIYRSPEGTVSLLVSTGISYAKEAMESASMTLRKDLIQFDVVRDVGIPVITRLLCDMFNLNLRSPTNPDGDLSIATMYTHLMNVRTWGFNDSDIALSWKRRMLAEKSALALTDSTATSVESTLSPFSAESGDKDLRSFGQTAVREMKEAGKTQAEIVDICFLTAVAGVGVTQSLITDMLQFFFKPENAELWAKLQILAADKDVASAAKQIKQYVKEAQRLTSSQRLLRVCVAPVTVMGKEYKPFQRIGFGLGFAGQKSPSIPEPGAFKLDRPEDVYLSFGWGPHQCLGREIAWAFATSMLTVLASMKNLRPAPGDMGKLNKVNVLGETYFLNDSWSFLTSDPSTWTLHFEGYGPGVYAPPASVMDSHNLDAVKNALDKQSKDNAAKPVAATTEPPAKTS